MAAERRFPMVAVKLLLQQISGLQSFSEVGGGFGDVSARSILPLPFTLGWGILSSLVLGLDSGLSVRVLMSAEIFPSPFSTGDGRCVFNVSDAPWMVAPGAGSCDTSNAWSLLEVRSEVVVPAAAAFIVGVQRNQSKMTNKLVKGFFVISDFFRCLFVIWGCTVL
jgi:hypothetical protein